MYSLVVWVTVGAGAGLAVLRSANSGVTKEARSALVTELALGVVQATLEQEMYHVYRHAHLPDMLLSNHNLTNIGHVLNPALRTVQVPVSGRQESECPLQSHSSQWPRYKPPPVRVYPGAQSLKKRDVIKIIIQQ